jgi:predicted TIM-barrel fold metal-dependent hydrolase
MIDANVSLSRWPCRRLPLDEPATLVAALRRLGFTQAWAGSFDGLLHRDVAGVNRRLAADCRTLGDGILVAFGTVNPTLPDWREDLRRCHEEHRMPGIRLHPNYHGYDLDDPRLAALLDEAAARSLIVQVVAAMEDERTQHPLLRVPPVHPDPLAGLVARRPALRVVLLNAGFRPDSDRLKRLVDTRRIWIDTAMLEGIAVLERVVAAIGSDRLLIGSHSPFYCLEAAPLKLQEAALKDADRLAVAEGNARSMLLTPGK